MNPTNEELLTITEASTNYFQGKVSGRQLTRLFHAGKLTGFRAGTKIVLYRSALDAWRKSNENAPKEFPESSEPG
jgi:hypothetical protein